MPELEHRLRALGEDVLWPATPDLASGVVARIGARPAAAPARRPVRRRLALGVALALLVPATVAVAFPSARDDVLSWLGVQGAEVRRATELPAARAPEPDDLGRRVSAGEAERLAGFRPVVASDALGPPRELRYDGATGFVSALYDDGTLVAQARGALSRELVEKVVAIGTGVRPVTVDGARGVWIDGPHAYFYTRPGGVIGKDHPRRARRALVFNRGDLLVRIEGPPLARALAIARSLR